MYKPFYPFKTRSDPNLGDRTYIKVDDITSIWEKDNQVRITVGGNNIIVDYSLDKVLEMVGVLGKNYV